MVTMICQDRRRCFLITRFLITRSLATSFCLLALAGLNHEALAANQTATVTPVIVGGALPYSVELRQYDFGTASVPSLHSYVAGEHNGQWVVMAGLTNGLHGFDIDQGTIPDRKQNRSVWVIDPIAKTSWSRSWDPSEAGSGLSETETLSITAANAQFEQVGDTLYVTGGYGDDDLADETSRGTFATLSAIDLPGIVDWVKGGTGLASDHFRQVSDPLFKVTGGDMYEINGQMHLIFGQDYEGAYRGNLNGAYTKQVRTFTINDDGTTLGFTHVGSSAPEEHFRRRDLNVFPTLKTLADGSLEEGITVLSGVFTQSRGAWTVPVEIDATGNPVQADGGNDPLNADGSLDASTDVFRQAMNNYHSAKVGLFSEETGTMHELLFGGITLQEYDPENPLADANGFVIDPALPNTNQLTSVLRLEDGSYEQHYLGEFPELYTVGGAQKRFGSNAEFFPDINMETYYNGAIPLDVLKGGADANGEMRIGFIFGGLVTNAPHVFGNPTGLSSASGELFEVILVFPVPEPSAVGLLMLAASVLLRPRIVC